MRRHELTKLKRRLNAPLSKILPRHYEPMTVENRCYDGISRGGTAVGLAAPADSAREARMPLYMYQLAYTPGSWAAQLKSPKSRMETVGRSLCEAAGGKFVGAWYCFGEYDAILIADMPDAESMSALALSVAAGGAAKAGKTTALMTGAQAVAAMTKAATLSKSYKPAR